MPLTNLLNIDYSYNYEAYAALSKDYANAKDKKHKYEATFGTEKHTFYDAHKDSETKETDDACEGAKAKEIDIGFMYLHTGKKGDRVVCCFDISRKYSHANSLYLLQDEQEPQSLRGFTIWMSDGINYCYPACNLHSSEMGSASYKVPIEEINHRLSSAENLKQTRNDALKFEKKQILDKINNTNPVYDIEVYGMDGTVLENHRLRCPSSMNSITIRRQEENAFTKTQLPALNDIELNSVCIFLRMIEYQFQHFPVTIKKMENK